MELPSLRNKKLKSQAKILLLNVANYFQRKKLELASSSGEDMNVNKAIAEATGVSMTTVKKVLSQSRSGNPEEAIKPPSKMIKRNRKIEVDSFTEGVIRRKVNMYYIIRKELPIVKNMLQELKGDGILNCEREFLRKYLHNMGFQWKKLQSKRSLVVENTDIVNKR